MFLERKLGDKYFSKSEENKITSKVTINWILTSIFEIKTQFCSINFYRIWYNSDIPIFISGFDELYLRSSSSDNKFEKSLKLTKWRQFVQKYKKSIQEKPILTFVSSFFFNLPFYKEDILWVLWEPGEFFVVIK